MNYKITPLEPFGVIVEPISKNTSVKDLNIEKMRDLFKQRQLVLLRGFETFEESDDFADYCEGWGEISIWPFGKVLDLIQKDDPGDHIFDSSYMPLHWDGMYRPQVPEYQIFQCVQAPKPGQGGRTTFTNTIMALENAPEEHVEFWKKVIGNYERKMEFYNSRTVSPIITKHPLQDHLVIRYNEPHFEERGDLLNPPDTQFTGITQEEVEYFHQTLREALYDPQNFYAHEWQTGDIVITDNFNLLHGREAFISQSPRHIRRVQVLSNPPFDNPSLESYQ
ncbi:PvcB protein [Vibrio nigripulchritudo SFn27]|uniref:PvcB protein n=1 Tax=Vibrio nigripulchritudo TaxID=28173 RepID=U4KHG9_9VIBR|nr:TauD/TfdA family dioxygenase [Vibrio nigripulchritudo]KJY78998.1 pyoverdine biosynthesis protein PvcB [Vibrio nigripulchritudo]CCN85527.1 PvcB protein [Vibrio nigripulchritudo BLFn1]CCN89005.1 PvcB protein [Vibrio nigripulchritudo SFn27]CCN95494.1 PvcB protein [Vibrio nigripulchritudo ENn2]CCO43252.1 PvcB protein [Vibrio nigripulchritudo SFn135]